MVYDVDYHEERKEPLKQLFVSRSSKIKNLVQGFVLDGCKGSEAKFESVFKTYDRMVRECNETLVKLGQSTTVAKMEFAALERKFDDFEEQFFPSAKKELKVNLSALVVWTQIR
jgi:ATP-dependent protease HslVU (ClpYQ) peptidase subunit